MSNTGLQDGFDRDSNEDHRALLALSMVSGVGAGRVRQLVAHFGSAQLVLDAPAKALRQLKGVGDGLAQSIVAFDAYDAIDEQLQWAERAHATLLPFWDHRFPEQLDRIYDPPAFLWVRGDINVLSSHGIAIVGTRKPSAYGIKAASYFAKALCEHGFTIVSGLAYGIDAEAHQAALNAGGHSVAVLGSGIDRIYPAKHAGLARDLMLQGAIVSELPLRSKPDAVNFPKRNRIISGLALGTLVVEAFEKGGALITARLAVEQNREVFAVPGSMFHETASGCHALIKMGQAKLVCQVEDILEELGQYIVGTTNGRVSGKTNDIVDLSTLGAVERRLYDVLTSDPKQIDAICREAGLDVSTALVYLLSLEFKGLVYQLAGKQFYRV